MPSAATGVSMIAGLLIGGRYRLMERKNQGSSGVGGGRRWFFCGQTHRGSRHEGVYRRGES